MQNKPDNDPELQSSWLLNVVTELNQGLLTVHTAEKKRHVEEPLTEISMKYVNDVRSLIGRLFSVCRATRDPIISYFSPPLM